MRQGGEKGRGREETGDGEEWPICHKNPIQCRLLIIFHWHTGC